ncbi:phosphoglycerate dehydrogenase [Coprothermobacter platensis]|uniref:phosphoglycerate dehydrogenase n=1 Tax=Coprothermobacter platensis TaxID=108819 RepID=UPI00035D6AF5|nr:phosphoglycerate dehydrogenase [Coprothermobacter platensis]
MAKWKVVATAVTFGRINKEPLERLQKAGCEVLLNPYGRPLTEDEMIKLASDADAIIVGNDKVTRHIMENCKNLKLIAKHGVGTDGIDINAAKTLGITVTNAPATNNEEVADLTFGLMIALARGICKANTDTKNGKWIKPTGVSLYQKTIGIVGVGAIGRAVSKRATGFSMNILGYDTMENEEAKRLGLKFVPLDTLLQQSDFITLHLPLTNDTRNLLNKDRFQQIKKGAILINTARSQLLDMDALYKALTDGTLRGYGTDVYDFEPPEHLPFFDLENVILTPHIGGTTLESNLRMGNTAVDNVLAVLNGQIPPNVVEG